MSSVPGPHTTSDGRSLLLHREVARRLREQPELLDKARKRVEEWAQTGTVHAEYVAEWRRALATGLSAVVAILEGPGERGQALRQVVAVNTSGAVLVVSRRRAVLLCASARWSVVRTLAAQPCGLWEE